MKNREIATLLDLSVERLSTVFGEMNMAGLVKKAGGSYQITEDGKYRLAQFADRVLRASERVEKELRAHAPYLELMDFTRKVIDSDLLLKFKDARKPTKTKSHKKA